MDTITKEIYRERMLELKERYKYNDNDVAKYKKLLTEVFDIRYSILMDDLIDKEREIYALSKTEGTQQEQINLYREIQVELRSLTDEARKFGLKEDSNYIIALSDLWNKYMDIITNLQNQ